MRENRSAEKLRRRHKTRAPICLIRIANSVLFMQRILHKQLVTYIFRSLFSTAPENVCT